MLRIASRIPEKYVVVKGAGQSDFGPGLDPWETASYDLALLDAGIENANIVKYTSVLPPESVEIGMGEAESEGLMHHGMALETIMAQVNGNQGEHICAGVGRAQVYDADGIHIGGFAAEYEGYGSETLARKRLQQALEGIFTRRYAHREGWYMEGEEFTTQDLCVDDKYGCVLVALCFVTFIIPEV
jgi:arginine decarboxylase